MSCPSHISSSCATFFIANASPTTPSRRSSPRERQRRHDRGRNRQPVRRGVHLLLGQIQLAGPDVLVRVELDLLEADDARDDVDLAVGSRRFRDPGSGIRDPKSLCHAIARSRNLIGSRIPDPGSRLERIQNRHLRVGDRVGVVVAVDRADDRPCGRRSRGARPGTAALRRCRWPSRAASPGRW